jgi:hypothetical protein
MADSPSTPLERVIDSARAALVGEMPMPDVASLAARARSRTRRQRGVAGGLVALSIAVMGLMARTAFQAQPVTFVVHGEAFSDSGFVRTAPTQHATLRFSDESSVSVHPDTQAQVTERRQNGATLRVSAGRVDVVVIHRSDTSWEVAPGPFVVHVTGTRFSAAWKPVDDEAIVEVEEGSVSIEGPGLQTPVVLRPGQRFKGSVRPGAVRYEVEASSAPSLAEPQAPPDVEPRPSASSGGLDAGPTRIAPSVVVLPTLKTDWTAWSAAGDFERIVRDSEREGVKVVLAQRSVADLLVLGDAARYLSNGVLARQAFEAAHARGKGTPRAAIASFRLGQLIEPSDSTLADAWYQGCLAEDPEGPLAAEALGRRVLLARHRNPAIARALAEEYLKRFPTGGAAGVARALVR